MHPLCALIYIEKEQINIKKNIPVTAFLSFCT